MCSHVVHSVADLAEGLVADGASQALASAPSLRIFFEGLLQYFHDLIKVIALPVLILFTIFLRIRHYFFLSFCVSIIDIANLSLIQRLLSLSYLINRIGLRLVKIWLIYTIVARR